MSLTVWLAFLGASIIPKVLRIVHRVGGGALMGACAGAAIMRTSQ